MALELEVVWEEVLAPGAYKAFEVTAGQRVRIVDIEGQQVTDFISLNRNDTKERLSMYTSRAAARSWKLSAGHVLTSTLARDMWLIEEDTVGENYAGGGFCNPAINEKRYGTRDDATCYHNFIAALAPFGLGEHDFDYENCFNVFMTIAYEPDGRWEIREPLSRAGDQMLLLALMDQIVAISNCPQIRNDCNARRLKPVQISVLREKNT